MIRSYTIDNDLAGAGERAIEVTVTLTDERRRWCFFTTPRALASCGDWVPGTQVRLHLGEPHMIIVGELSVAIIEQVLREIERTGELERRTLPLAAG
jgi:hypothetical protein